ncbi:MAG TPA: tRNA lysidine(34) synthetase TilS, partial [Polyangia bacterium]
MLSRVLRTIHEHALIRPEERVLVAVSGGPDSVALLHALAHLAPRLRVAIEAATVDHGLRGGSSDEAAAVVRLCAGLGLPCALLRPDVGVHRGPHVSLQDAARRARLGALRDLARARGCSRIALGHTADDQAETILFRIVRGTGVRGLAGIPYERDDFIRPLLDVRRRDVLRFLARRRISFIEDPANRDPRHTRSRVRGAWLPFLATENPRIVEALLALGDEARRMPAPPEVLTAVPRRTRRLVENLVAAPDGTHLIDTKVGLIAVAYDRVTVHPGVRSRGSTIAASGTPAADFEQNLAVGEALRWDVVSDKFSTNDYSNNVKEIEARLQEGAAGPPPGRATFAAEIAVDGLRVRRL